MSTIGTIIEVNVDKEKVFGFGINGGLPGSEMFAFGQLMVECLNFNLSNEDLIQQADTLLGQGVFDAASVILRPEEFDKFEAFVPVSLNINKDANNTFDFGDFYLVEDHDEAETDLEDQEEDLILVFPYKSILASEEVLLTTADWYSRVVESNTNDYLAILSDEVCEAESEIFVTDPTVPNAYFITFENLGNLISKYNDDNKVCLGKLE